MRKTKTRRGNPNPVAPPKFVASQKQRQGGAKGELGKPICLRLPVEVREAIYGQSEPLAFIRDSVIDAARRARLIEGESPQSDGDIEGIPIAKTPQSIRLTEPVSDAIAQLPKGEFARIARETLHQEFKRRGLI